MKNLEPFSANPYREIGGFLIAIEGIDGSGHTTQTELSRDHFGKTRTVHYEHEPRYGTPIGEQIKDILVNHREIEPITLQKLYIKNRADHIENDYLPTLKNGGLMFCDRYIFSTLAYGATEGLDTDLLANLQTGFVFPDITIIYLPPVSVCIERIKKRGKPEKFDTEEKLGRASQKYRELAERYPNVHIIDSIGNIGEVWLETKQILEKALAR
jgi:dTMP kinase